MGWSALSHYTMSHTHHTFTQTSLVYAGFGATQASKLVLEAATISNAFMSISDASLISGVSSQSSLFNTPIHHDHDRFHLSYFMQDLGTPHRDALSF